MEGEEEMEERRRPMTAGRQTNRNYVSDTQRLFRNAAWKQTALGGSSRSTWMEGLNAASPPEAARLRNRVPHTVGQVEEMFIRQEVPDVNPLTGTQTPAGHRRRVVPGDESSPTIYWAQCIAALEDNLDKLQVAPADPELIAAYLRQLAESVPPNFGNTITNMLVQLQEEAAAEQGQSPEPPPADMGRDVGASAQESIIRTAQVENATTSDVSFAAGANAAAAEAALEDQQRQLPHRAQPSSPGVRAVHAPVPSPQQQAVERQARELAQTSEIVMRHGDPDAFEAGSASGEEHVQRGELPPDTVLSWASPLQNWPPGTHVRTITPEAAREARSAGLVPVRVPASDPTVPMYLSTEELRYLQELREAEHRPPVSPQREEETRTAYSVRVGNEILRRLQEQGFGPRSLIDRDMIAPSTSVPFGGHGSSHLTTVEAERRAAAAELNLPFYTLQELNEEERLLPSPPPSPAPSPLSSTPISTPASPHRGRPHYDTSGLPQEDTRMLVERLLEQIERARSLVLQTYESDPEAFAENIAPRLPPMWRHPRTLDAAQYIAVTSQGSRTHYDPLRLTRLFGKLRRDEARRIQQLTQTDLAAAIHLIVEHAIDNAIKNAGSFIRLSTDIATETGRVPISERQAMAFADYLTQTLWPLIKERIDHELASAFGPPS